MRVCIHCGKFGARVETCTDKTQCRIANKGTEIIPPGDHIGVNLTGKEIIEMTSSNEPVPGDAMMGVGSAIKIPTVSRFNSGTVADPLPDAMKTIEAGLRPPSLDEVFDLAVKVKESKSLAVCRAIFNAHGADDGKLAGVPRSHYAALKQALIAELGKPAEVTSDPVLPLRGPRAPVTSPDGNPKTAIGMTKPSLHSIPPVALVHLGLAMADGNRKYGLVNWRHDPITMSVYVDAIWRHFLALWDGQDVDPKTGIKHLAYIMANCAILLDAEASGTLTDDRSPILGKVAELIEQLTNMKKET